jgi:hypothetical protein
MLCRNSLAVSVLLLSCLAGAAKDKKKVLLPAFSAPHPCRPVPARNADPKSVNVDRRKTAVGAEATCFLLRL